jgi:hypothetical protein
MSEQIPSSDTSDFAPRGDNFEWYEAAEAVVNRIKNAGRDLAKLSYSSQEDAMRDTSVFQAEIVSIVSQYSGLKQVVLRSSGDGVQEVVVQTPGSHDGDAGAVFEAITMPDSKNPFTPVPPYESRDFLFDCVRFFVTEVAADDWRIATILYGEKALEPIQQLTDDDEPFLTVVLKPALRIDCGENNTPFEIVDLINERERVQALRELSESAGEDWPEVFSLIKKLDDAVNEEDHGSLTDFEDLQSLHDLGKIGARYAASDTNRLDSLTAAVAAVLGEGRYLALDGVSYSFESGGDVTEESVRGLCGYVETIVPDVPMFAGIPRQPAGPAFVIRNGKKTYSMPFTQVSRMSL